MLKIITYRLVLLFASITVLCPSWSYSQSSTKSLTEMNLIPLDSPIKRIYPAGTETIATVNHSIPEVQLIDVDTGSINARLSLNSEPLSFLPFVGSSGLWQFATITRANTNTSTGSDSQLNGYAVGVLSAASEGLTRKNYGGELIPAIFQDPTIGPVFSKERKSFLVWDRSLAPTSSSYRIVEPTLTREVQSKAAPYELLAVRSDSYMLALQPRRAGASLIDIRTGRILDDVFVPGISVHKPEGLAVFAPRAASGGTGEVVIANVEEETLTVLSVQSGSRLPRIDLPLQISLRSSPLIRRSGRQLLVVADRALSLILVGSVGTNKLSVFRKTRGAIEEILPIELRAPIADMTVLHGATNIDPDLFVFLREDGRELAVASQSTLYQSESPGQLEQDGTATVSVPVEDPKVPEKPAFVNEQLDAVSVTRLQRVLAALGYPVSAIDGRIGPQTTAAIRAFQYDKGIEAIGSLSEETLKALNAAVAEVGDVRASNKSYADEYDRFMQQRVPGVDAERLLTLGSSNKDPDSPCFALNSLPPRELWSNSVAFARVLKRVEEEFGLKVEVVSGYRSPEYSRCAARGDVGSYHVKFQAFDIRLADQTNAEKDNAILFDAIKKIRDTGEFQGGLDATVTSVHVDTRGVNVMIGVDSELTSP